MGNIKKRVTILAIGDRADYDSHKKLHKEKRFILRSGFDYVRITYKRFFEKGMPRIKSEKIIVFLFFPFSYWNKYIEHRTYRGIYGNKTFYRKFTRFWKRVDKMLKNSLFEKEVLFVNLSSACGLCRDKLDVTKKISRAGIPSPKTYSFSRVEKIDRLLEKGQSFFVKPRYGSMGKGITFLSKPSWQTNFLFRKNKIISRKSDKGWKFRDITGNRKFLAKLLKKDIIIEKAVDSLLVKNMKMDMRVYVFFNKVIYIYPRRNRVGRITTNISQGAKGDPGMLKKIPKKLLRKVKKTAENTTKQLGLNMAGVDIMLDKNLRDLYVLDVNLFPGFPKRKTFNLARRVIKELAELGRSGNLKFSAIG